MKVAAIVVTYNRLNLLKECINAILSQTRIPNEIIIINNGSTDDTLSWLNKQIGLTIITQENLGSAGGQYTGIKTAYEKGYDWIWCMDDDGKPSPTALEQLELACIKNKTIKVANSVVININDVNNNELVWGFIPNWRIEKPFEGKRYLYLSELNIDFDSYESIPGSNLFFNSTLIHSSVIEKIGYPDVRLFIRGDEFEYFCRIQKAGYEMYAIPSSIMYHPQFPIHKFRFIKNFEHEIMGQMKLYYHTRNLYYISRKYFGVNRSLFSSIVSYIFKELYLRNISKKSLTLIFSEVKIIINASKEYKQLYINDL